MPTDLPEPRRILVVDDDRALAEELRGSLRVAGFDVEAVSLAAGLTPEFLVRLAPQLVLLDAAAGGLRRETVRTIVLGLRRQLGCSLLLMGSPGPTLAARAAELGADGAVDKTLLLKAPRGALSQESLAAEKAPGPSPRPPPLPRKAASGTHGAGSEREASALLSMIEEEIDRLGGGRSEAGLPSFHVVVDLFSENNFYLSKTPTGRLVGIFVATSLPPPVGTRVELTVVLLGGHRFETAGEVAWVRKRSPFASKLPAGAGIRMRDLQEIDKERIRSFLGQRAPYSYTGA